MARSGLRASSTDEQGLELFDAALRCRRGAGAAAAPRSQRRCALRPELGVLPPLFNDLVDARGTRSRGGQLACRSAWPIVRRDRARARRAGARAVARGHGARSRRSGGDRRRSRPFKELGFDSLTAVELRNRLNAATGLRCPPRSCSTIRPPPRSSPIMLREMSRGIARSMASTPART